MDVWAVFRQIFFGAVSVLMQVKIFGTNLFYLLMGFAALSVAITAIRMLFYGNGGEGK